jgi:serine/threonine protein phosphatase 1
MADCGDYCFVHAGVRPGVPLAEQKEEDVLWIRGLFLETAAEYGKLIVHGHTIRAEPEFRPWRIGIDTGAFSSGRLTALVLDGDRQDLIQAVA